MGSIPPLERAASSALVQIDGAMPRLTAIPPGCAFNPRCPQAFERCRERTAGPDGRRAPPAPPAGCYARRRAGARHERGTASSRRSDLARHFDVSQPVAQPRDRGRAAGASCAPSTASRSPSPSGETLALVGEIRLAASRRWRAWSVGLLPPTAGSVRSTASTCGAGARRERQTLRRRMQMIFQDPYASLNPRWRVGRHHRRADPRLRAGAHGRAEHRAPRRRAADAGRARSRRRRKYPARVLRRAAPAHLRSRARCRRSRNSSSATSRPRRSTCRCRRRSST